MFPCHAIVIVIAVVVVVVDDGLHITFVIHRNNLLSGGGLQAVNCDLNTYLFEQTLIINKTSLNSKLNHLLTINSNPSKTTLASDV